MRLEHLRKNLRRVLHTGDNGISFINLRYLPRWIVLCIDAGILIFSIVVSYFVLTNLKIQFYGTFTFAERYTLLFLTNFFFFFVFRTYAGLIRHSTFTDITKLLLASFSTAAVLTIFNYTYFFITGDKVYVMPALIIYIAMSFSFLLFFRLLVKQVYRTFKQPAAGPVRKRVVMFGVDDSTISIADALQADNLHPFEVVAFMTNNRLYKNIRILDKPVLQYKNNICDHLKEMRIHGLIIIGENLSKKAKNELVDECLAGGIQIYNVPMVERWNGKEDVAQQIKAIQIEDLLNREVIELDNQLIREDLEDKVILVTGGAGSIGSEIVRQVAAFNPKLMVVLDQSETALYNLELHMHDEFPGLNLVTELANISNMYRVSMVFENYDFDIIYHAAAYKHVPIIERNPQEAIYVNVLGTMNLVRIAVAYQIPKFVMVSTDKAVNPTNVMGASKRAAELYVQSIQHEKDVKTKFITTRFGNVLGSNGSVIPHFKRQIKNGGPVTVTHPDIIRYFMTIPEACQLVLQAGTMGKGGEIFVFDMGKPVRIMDLAVRMIRLSGFIPHEDIKIKVTGLRPGEKLYEELLADKTVNVPTHHPKIMAVKEEPLPFKELKGRFSALIKASLKGDEEKVVGILKDIVPEYKSENSKFCILDEQREEVK